jgi:hypothetical protein
MAFKSSNEEQKIGQGPLQMHLKNMNGNTWTHDVDVDGYIHVTKFFVNLLSDLGISYDSLCVEFKKYLKSYYVYVETEGRGIIPKIPGFCDHEVVKRFEKFIEGKVLLKRNEKTKSDEGDYHTKTLTFIDGTPFTIVVTDEGKLWSAPKKFSELIDQLGYEDLDSVAEKFFHYVSSRYGLHHSLHPGHLLPIVHNKNMMDTLDIFEEFIDGEKMDARIERGFHARPFSMEEALIGASGRSLPNPLYAPSKSISHPRVKRRSGKRKLRVESIKRV